MKHYVMTVDDDTDLDTGLDSAVERHEFVNDGEPDPVDRAVFDVYIDESNQMVRLKYGFRLMGEFTSVEVTMTATDDVVDIDVPRRADVIEWDDVEF